MTPTVDRGTLTAARRLVVWLLFAFLVHLPAFAQVPETVGLPIADVHVEQEGQRVVDRVILALIGTEIGEPLSMDDVRQTVDHLYGLGRFDDIVVSAERSGDGVLVRYELVPRHVVQALVFEGALGLPEDELRQAVSERFGALPPASRLNDVARELLAVYRDHGYANSTIKPRIDEFHNPDRSVMVVSIDSGTRARIGSLEVEGLDQADRTALLRETELRVGAPYDAAAIQERLARYENNLRSRGFYEARASHAATFTDAGQAAVTVSVEPGPRVSIAFAGDPLPPDVRDELVPVRREGSADEDLLEDASRAIEEYLHARGYRDARAPYTREERGAELVITFTVRRGPRYVLDDVAVKGNTAVTREEILELLALKTDAPYVEAEVDAGIGALQQQYLTRGFTRAEIEPELATLPGANGSATNANRHVLLTLVVAEGPRTLVGSIAIAGNAVFSEPQLREVMTTAPGQPYSEVQVAQDRDRIHLEYLNRGYESAVVEPHVNLVEGDTRAEIRFDISEGPQVIVDEVIIIGNERTSTETIEREVLLKPGEPLGYAARLESQQRLSALGLFRLVRITELRHGSEPRRDVLVEVEEAPPTTIGYGGGVEVDARLRPTGEGRTAEEQIEAAPRGFFEIGRRNLWGKNRAVNLFTRVSLRSRFRDQEEIPTEEVSGELGFNEYRVVGTFREPRIFDTRADLLVTGILDQALRSSFNFRRRQVRAEVGMRISQQYGFAGRYSFERTELFDEQFTDPDEPLLIDRFFPQVRLSKFSLSVFRDTRDDPLDPNRGSFLSADNDLAARVAGSEVGFAKTFLGALAFHRLPWQRRTVLALAARVGLAQGFPRTVNEQIVEDLPASERFFAGGDTTVRGFSLDRLGTEETITETGFPRGGNGVVVLNAELRVNVWRSLGMVGFVDAGNVFLRASDIDLTDLRPATGFGLRYRSPIGPLRVDLGFNLDPRELVPGRLERRPVLHVSLGQAF
jgi:outer membrane protein insertion porin family